MGRLVDAIARAVFPERCAACGARGVALCRGCIARCRAPDRPAPPGVDAWAAACAYRSAVRTTIVRAKYHRRYRALDAFVPVLVDCAAALGPVDAVVAPPPAHAHYAVRGYDPARALAQAVARRLGVPHLEVLRRTDAAPQTGRDRHARARGPAVDVVAPVPPRVLVIDDVATTGATLAAVAVALRAGGAVRVVGATAARR